MMVKLAHHELVLDRVLQNVHPFRVLDVEGVLAEMRGYVPHHVVDVGPENGVEARRGILRIRSDIELPERLNSHLHVRHPPLPPEARMRARPRLHPLALPARARDLVVEREPVGGARLPHVVTDELGAADHALPRRDQRLHARVHHAARVRGYPIAEAGAGVGDQVGGVDERPVIAVTRLLDLSEGNRPCARDLRDHPQRPGPVPVSGGDSLSDGAPSGGLAEGAECAQPEDAPAAPMRAVHDARTRDRLDLVTVVLPRHELPVLGRHLDARVESGARGVGVRRRVEQLDGDRGLAVEEGELDGAGALERGRRRHLQRRPLERAPPHARREVLGRVVIGRLVGHVERVAEEVVL
mmetsp:Transcript_31277/g.74301  ORF Transcript_31277/g.74301 Transcript_31277/m.74301 type:complete len:354 (+) Transcript_31277:2547-3608(+)